LHRNKYYNPELDRKAKVEELRSLYESSIASGRSGDENEDSKEDDDSFVSENVSKYFELEKQQSRSSEDTERGNINGSQEKLVGDGMKGDSCEKGKETDIRE